MNLELIRKYEKEFLHMLHGGKLKYFTGKEWLTYSGVEMWTANNDLKIIIDDEYIEFRKALAEGKTVQYRVLWSNKSIAVDWTDTVEIADKSIGAITEFRIKPEQPKFKAGDYVRYIHANSPKPLQIVNINCERYYFENAEIILRLDEIERWEPKEGEICIFWEEDSEYDRAIIGKLKQILSNGNYVMDYGSGYTVTYSKCMPFTGILPPHMKD